jgi:hypothetical protein
MSTHERVNDLIEIILKTVAQEAHTTQEHLSVEVESVVTRGVLEAFKRGSEDAHDRPTEPPPSPVRSVTPRGMPAVRNPTPAGPMPVVRPRTPSRPIHLTPQPRLPVKDPRRDED